MPAIIGIIRKEFGIITVCLGIISPYFGIIFTSAYVMTNKNCWPI